jgi:GTPase
VKSGFVAVAGRPNVGKSTLVNALCGGKVAIVSDKPQTTLRRILGVANGEGYQLVLATSLASSGRATRSRNTCSAPWIRRSRTSRECSSCCRRGDRFIAERVFALGVPVVIALNKVDRLKPAHIASQMDTAARLGDFQALHPVSAKTGDGVGALREELVELLPEGPLYFPPEQRTDLSVEAQIAELVREKALELTRE